MLAQVGTTVDLEWMEITYIIFLRFSDSRFWVCKCYCYSNNKFHLTVKFAKIFDPEFLMM